ncbi:MAG TPA: hypothetical protein VGM43_12300 [Bryobacteraceae bacterium]|jgi:hypothetical protein
MNFRTFLFVSALAAPLSAFAQSPFPLSVGLKAGAALTDAFSNRTILAGATAFRTYSQQKDYIVGPMVELRLPMGLSAEADALYRPLHLASSPGSDGTVNSWEFPILVKYHLKFPIVKPFVEAGPSFRHVSEFPSDIPHLSSKGFAAGFGVEVKALVVRVAPEFRYTHWGADSNASTSSVNPNSHSNQLEFLLGISF